MVKKNNIYANMVYTLLDEISITKTHKGVYNMLNEYDMESKLKIILSVVNDISDQVKVDTPVSVALGEICSMIVNIENNFIVIKNLISKYTITDIQKDPNCHSCITSIIRYYDILLSRFTLLLEILKIYKVSGSLK